MASVNKVILIGNLGRDPEVRYTPAGRAVVSLSLATTDRYANKDGEKQERVEWHNVVLWDKLAEVAGKYLEKGSPCYIEGKLSTKTWEDKETQAKRFRVEIVGHNLQLLGSGGARNDTPQVQVEDYNDNGDDNLPF